MRKLLLFMVFLFLPAMAKGQGYLYTGIALNQNGRPIPNPTITVCTASGTGVPCTPTAGVSLFSDAAMTLPVSNPLANCTNIFQSGCSDAVGNFSFYIAPGEYTYTISGSGTTLFGPFKISIPCTVNNGLDSCGVTGPFAYVPDSSSTYLSHATPTFQMGGTQGNKSTIFDFVLNQNVTAITFSVSNPPTPGTTIIAQLNLCENGTGGFTIPNGAWPINVILPTGFTYTPTTAGSCNQLAFRYNPQTNTWTPWQIIGGGGGGGVTPTGSDGDLQKKSGSNLVPSGLNDNGTTVTSSEPFTVNALLTQNANAAFKGPNPYFDITNYSGYIGLSNAPVTTTGSITSGTPTLTIASAQDFANGQGIVVNLAGLTPVGRNASFPAVPTGTVTPVGVTNGSTTYNYKFVLEDYFGGLTASGTQFSTSAGASTLGTTTVGLDTVSRVGGIDTFHCTANCNVAVNSQVQISGFVNGTNSNVNGTVVIATAPDATHFTVNAQGLPDYSESASGTLSVKACNDLFPSGTLSQESVILRTWIYRGNNLVGVAPGQDPYFRDCGQGVTNQPSYVPTTAPGSAQAGYLATTIASGGGTTTLTLAANAGTTATTQTVIHDNTPALKAAYTAALAAHGGIVRLPVIGAGGFNTFPFNSTCDLTTISNPGQAAVRIEVANMVLNQPLIPSTFSWIMGIPQTNTSFNYQPLGLIGGTAHPYILGNFNSTGGIKISGIKFNATSTGQSSVVIDQKVGSGGEVGFQFEDDAFAGNLASAIVIKGGFDFWFMRGVCGVFGASGWDSAPCARFTNASTYLSSSTQAPGRITFDHTNFSGGVAMQIDNLPNQNSTGGGNLEVRNTLHESVSGAHVRVFLGSGQFGGVVIITHADTADQANGLHAPVLELTGNTQFNNITIQNIQASGPIPTILGGGTFAAPVCINNVFSLGCGQSPNQSILGSNSSLDGGTNALINGASLGIPLATPAAPASCVVSAGGSVPIGANIPYFIVATDRNPVTMAPFGGLTVLGPSCTVTTTGGNQTVTITRPTLPTGATGWLVWRNGAEAAIGGGGGNCFIPIPASTTTFVDTFSFTCGFSGPSATTAFLNGIIPDRVKGNLGDFNGIRSTPTSTKTSAYTPTVNDNLIPVDASGGGFTVSLNPAIIGSHWVILRYDNVPANVLTIAPTSGSIDGSGSTTLSALSGIIITCDGVNCHTEARSSGGGAANINNALQFSFSYYSASGSSNTISGISPPTSNSTWKVVYQVVGNVALSPTIALDGIPVIQLTGSGSLDYTFRGADVRFSSCSTPTLTLPAIGGTTASNLPFTLTNGCSGNITITSTSPNAINGGSAGNSVTLFPGQFARFTQDNTPNWWASFYVTTAGVPTNCTALNNSATLGFICATLPVVSNVNSQTSTYTAVVGDNGKIVSMNGSSITLNLPASAPAQPWGIYVQNLNASSLTVSRNGLLIDGAAANIVVPQNQGLWITTDSTNYFTARGLSSATAGVSSLTGDGALITNSGSTGTTTLTLGNAAAHTYWGRNAGSSGAPAYNSIGTGDLPAVTLRRVCTISVGDTSGSAITNAQLGPQKKICFVPAAATVLEIEVTADAGTPNVIVGRNRAGTTTNLLSSALATAASGAIACSNTGGTTGLDGTTTCSSTLQNTSTNAGDFFELVSGTAGGTAKFFTANIVYTIN